MLIGPQNSSVERAVAANLRAVQEQIAAAVGAAHRSEESVTLVAVSKGHGPEMVRCAAACGVAHCGESYLQEALPKIEQLRDVRLVWHFIGRLQANKTRPIAEQFDWVHGVDRLKIAERLSAQRPHHAPPLNLCVQVNIASEIGKAGVEPAGAAPLVQAIQALPRLKLRGLMCILPEGQSEPDNRRAFRAMRLLLERLNAEGAELDVLSMGMSADFRAAILEGATHVRIGTAVFGPRAVAPAEMAS